jgi:hypothetical protein
MFHEYLSFVVDNQEIFVQFHRVLFPLVNVIVVRVQMYEVFPKDIIRKFFSMKKKEKYLI